MKHVRCEFTSPTSYFLTVDGVRQPVITCKLVVIPNGKKDDVINPTHNEAWVRMNKEAES